MAAKPRKSVVQNIIKNLLEMEIPEIQNASKELGDWIKQLEQHSFKLQHYATEIENWAAEEEEVDSIELTDLIKDLEATLTDMRKGRVPQALKEDTDESDEATEKMLRGYGLIGRPAKDPKALPKSEIKGEEKAATARPALPIKPVEPKIETARTPHGVLIARDIEKPKAKTEIPTGNKEVVKHEIEKPPVAEEDDARGYMTPEGFRIRRMRP